MSAGHCMVFAKSESKTVGFDTKAIVLMQMRFDGKLGFTGGIIEEDDGSIEIGIGREMQEEMGVDPGEHPLTKENHVSSQPFDCKSLPHIKTLHFYALQVSEEAISRIEENARKAIHYGEEVLGWIRVPLYTMEDGYNGFPAFLDNNFVGNAREQLIDALIKTGIMSKEETELALKASKSAA
ncbi:U8 snoRNA-decapping enzyme-like [Neocloeon triangulifer]|uniref:U8 snoRNA-decapping enzyme-like n=1 Tax=Neocloeon triangulifer TaxID=2078957 RepID=UPI00286EE484|nr:U8 snoRNA-decapping enzyme-like [Neocloeon triangulifer]XP_059485349.1 U8 snoRNA-decapping enzyme-like [Neocloeon triangulifer]XP_059485350.1 U8 snoRNA-decapping enzyme-like [Neocloeon triangulifer]